MISDNERFVHDESERETKRKGETIDKNKCTQILQHLYCQILKKKKWINQTEQHDKTERMKI